MSFLTITSYHLIFLRHLLYNYEKIITWSPKVDGSRVFDFWRLLLVSTMNNCGGSREGVSET